MNTEQPNEKPIQVQEVQTEEEYVPPLLPATSWDQQLEPPPPSEGEPSGWQGLKLILREGVETAVLSLLVFLLMRAVVQNFRIEGYSMEPNLHQGQYLIVNKAVYRWVHPPERGDIIVFEYPRAPDRDFIKRVIGLPGEKVEIRNGVVYINDKPLPEPYLKNHRGHGNFPPTVLGPDQYFVLGDNRDNSSDSRMWGPLPKDNIIGKAWISYWPPQMWGLIPDANYSFASPQ